MTILSRCLGTCPFFRSLRRGTNDPSDPAHEMTLRVLIVMLKDNSFSDDYPLIPRRRHHALLTAAAAQSALDQCEARQRPLSAAPTPPSAPSAAARPRHGLSDGSGWRYDGELCPALGPGQNLTLTCTSD